MPPKRPTRSAASSVAAADVSPPAANVEAAASAPAKRKMGEKEKMKEAAVEAPPQPAPLDPRGRKVAAVVENEEKVGDVNEEEMEEEDEESTDEEEDEEECEDESDDDIKLVMTGPARYRSFANKYVRPGLEGGAGAGTAGSTAASAAATMAEGGKAAGEEKEGEEEEEAAEERRRAAAWEGFGADDEEGKEGEGEREGEDEADMFTDPLKHPAIRDYREKFHDEDFPPTDQLRLRFKRTAFDIDINTVEEKGWDRSGASPADYFNYGFVEESWALYSEKQIRLRWLAQKRDVQTAQEEEIMLASILEAKAAEGRKFEEEEEAEWGRIRGGVEGGGGGGEETNFSPPLREGLPPAMYRGEGGRRGGRGGGGGPGSSTRTTGAHRHLSTAGEVEEEVAFGVGVGGGVEGSLRMIGVEGEDEVEEGGEEGGGLHRITLASHPMACRRLNFIMKGVEREGEKKNETPPRLRREECRHHVGRRPGREEGEVTGGKKEGGRAGTDGVVVEEAALTMSGRSPRGEVAVIENEKEGKGIESEAGVGVGAGRVSAVRIGESAVSGEEEVATKSASGYGDEELKKMETDCLRSKCGSKSGVFFVAYVWLPKAQTEEVFKSSTAIFGGCVLVAFAFLSPLAVFPA
ncbi:hypothetical protein VYU27_002297 [Nannochloropsis oceanica]